MRDLLSGWIPVGALLVGMAAGAPSALAAAGPGACDARVPPPAQTLLARGDRAAQLGSRSVAEQEYRKALAAAPGTPALLYRLALLHTNSENEIGGLAYFRAYLEAVNGPRSPCVPVPAPDVQQVIQDLEAKVESKAGLAFQAAIEAIGTVPEDDRPQVARETTLDLAEAEQWHLAESLARRYPLGMTEAIAVKVAMGLAGTPLGVRMFDLAERLALIDPPDSKLTREAGCVLCPPEIAPPIGPSILPGETEEERRARLERTRIVQEGQARQRLAADRPKWRVSCQATRLLAVALEEERSWFPARAWDTIVRSQTLLAREGLRYGDQCWFRSPGLVNLGNNGVSARFPNGAMIAVTYTPGQLKRERDGVILTAPWAPSEEERRATAAARRDVSAVSVCAFDPAFRVRWLDLIEGRTEKWWVPVKAWTSDGLFGDFRGWVQELTPKSPPDRARTLSKGGRRLLETLEHLRACGTGGES